MPKSITFKQIVKLVHPDLNPNLVNTTSKMNSIRIYRKDERFLYKLGVKWGVIIEDISKPTVRVVPNNTSPKVLWSNSNLTFVVGVDVFIITKGVYAKVVKITEKRVYYKSTTGQESFVLKKNARVL